MAEWISYEPPKARGEEGGSEGGGQREREVQEERSRWVTEGGQLEEEEREGGDEEGEGRKSKGGRPSLPTWVR